MKNGRNSLRIPPRLMTRCRKAKSHPAAVKKSSQMRKRLVRPERIRFGHILKESHTYNIFKNRYIRYGFLIGLPIPLICFSSMHRACFNNSIHWVYFFIPFIFSFLFGCLGTFKIMSESQAESYKLLYRIKTKEQYTG